MGESVSSKPLAYLKEWEVDGDKRTRVDLHSDCEPWLRGYRPHITPLYARPADETTCTCPSGDGSLRWPCPVHPPSAARRCHCGKFAMHADMALITDTHAHDHVFDGTPCDCEDEPACSAVEPAERPALGETCPTHGWYRLNAAGCPVCHYAKQQQHVKATPVTWTCESCGMRGRPADTDVCINCGERRQVQHTASQQE